MNFKILGGSNKNRIADLTAIALIIGLLFLELRMLFTDINRQEFDLSMHVFHISLLILAITFFVLRYQTYSALIRAKNEYQQLVEQSEVAILSIKGYEGKIIFHNPKVSSLLKCSSQQLDKMTLFDFIHNQDVEFVKSKINEIYRGLPDKKDSEDLKFRVVRRDMKVIWVKMKLSLILHYNKEKIIQCNFWDITRDIELQDFQERFIAITSHELRTPVTIIRGYIEFL
ncbi:MAG: PAS domain S-box protein [Candidatus Hodarchaeales archaeon]